MQAAKMQAAEVQAVEVQAAEVQAAEIQAAEMQAAEVQAAEVQAAEMQAVEMQTAEMQAEEMQAAEVEWGTEFGHLQPSQLVIGVSKPLLVQMGILTLEEPYVNIDSEDCCILTDVICIPFYALAEGD